MKRTKELMMEEPKSKWELLDGIVPEGSDVFAVWAQASTDKKPPLWYRCVAVKINMREGRGGHRFDLNLECTRYPTVVLLAAAGEEGSKVFRGQADGGWELPAYPVTRQSEEQLTRLVDRKHTAQYLRLHMDGVAREIDALMEAEK